MSSTAQRCLRKNDVSTPPLIFYEFFIFTKDIVETKSIKK
jgi:hypothetical protein